MSCEENFQKNARSLSDRHLARAVVDVLDRHVLEHRGDTQAAGALGLVADRHVELARLVLADGARRVGNVVQLVVLARPAGIEARRDVVHRVGRGERQLAVVEEVLALLCGDVLVVHGDAAALVRGVLGRLPEGEVVPGVVGDVVGAGGRVDAQQVHGAAGVRDLDADVVAVDGAGPVGDAVRVDLAAEDADGGGVLGVRGDAGGAGVGAARGDGGAGDEGGRGGEEGGDGGEHVCGVLWWDPWADGVWW